MRIILAFFISLCISIGLFLGMQFMIHNNKISKEKKSVERLVYLREKVDENIKVKKRIKPKKRQEKKPPKKIKIVKTKIRTKVNKNVEIKAFKMDMKNIDVSLVSSLSGAQVSRNILGDKKITFVDTNTLVALKRVNPRYPRMAQRRKIQGYAKMTFLIDEKGKVSNVKVVESKPRKVFNEASINAIKKWRFKTNKAQNAIITFKFRL